MSQDYNHRVTRLETLLREALDQREGWRADARRELGLAAELECEVCVSSFEGGGKLKKRCHACVGVKKKRPGGQTR